MNSNVIVRKLKECDFWFSQGKLNQLQEKEKKKRKKLEGKCKTKSLTEYQWRKTF